MKINITSVRSEPEMVTITKREYNHLYNKASKYDQYKQAQRERANKINDILTPQQRIERAKAAANKRWNKEV